MNEREEFEKWWAMATDNESARCAWSAWQARASLPVKVPEGWQPIETAPKDGTKILLGRFVEKCQECRNGVIRIDYWHSTETGHKYAGWYEFNMAWWPPTHWMPLPAAPKEGRE